MSIIRAGCYERVSTDEQAMHGFSIETQIDNLTEYCKKSNIKIVDHYTDEGISGTKPPMKRPSLQRLLNDVQAGRIDIILFTKLDRWFRSVKEYFKVQEILDANKVEWKAIHEDYDTSTANGKMAITIFLAVAQNERDRTAERINVVFNYKRKNKEACFGGPVLPFGYKKERDNDGKSILVKNPDEEQAVSEFWKILINESNLTKAIRHMLNKYGISKNWKSWKRISNNEFYCGMYKGIEDFCEPYVSKEEWQAFQDRTVCKRTPSGNIYIFRSLLRCPECGSKLCGSFKRTKSGVYKSYRCKLRGRGCNNHTQVSEIKTEKQLLKKIKGFIGDEIAHIEIEQSKAKQKPKNNVNALKERQRRLTVAYMAGNIDDNEYLSADAEIKELIANARSEMQQKTKDVKPLKELLETDFESTYLTLNDEEKRQFWQRLLKEIKLDAKNVIGVDFL